ncbi:hypothetical protein J4219_06180 [Candidatus Woesearchaeota archaeon]|nr:hypothetical protein [Candidatus Woesearchaeota archaeon]
MKKVSRALAKARGKVAVLGRVRKTARKVGRKVKSISKGMARDARSARLDKAHAHKVHEQVQFDVKAHKLEQGMVKDAMHEVDELKCAADDLKFLADTARKVKNSKKK